MKNKLAAYVASCLIGTALLASPAFASNHTNDENSPWLVRVRALGVLPETSGSSVSTLGGSLKISNQVTPELDISYFFTKNIAAELVLATVRHEVRATTGNTDLGNVWLLPPTLTAQYHFDTGTRFKPYLGAGVNYTHFYNETPGATNNVHYKNTFGPALQVGTDVKITDHWVFNLDVKKVYIRPDVSVNHGAITSNAHIDPWLVGVGFGYRF